MHTLEVLPILRRDPVSVTERWFRLTYDGTTAEIGDTYGGVLQLQSSRKTGTTFHFVWLSSRHSHWRQYKRAGGEGRE